MAFNQNFTSTGLNTTTFSVPTAGVYPMSGKIQLPTVIGGGGASAVVATITQNSSTIYTGPAGAEGFGLTVNCAAGDVIAVALTSAADPDQGLNAVKAVIAFG